MADSELEHLRKMANQIALNFSYHTDQVERTADHIQRFWAPSMIRLLADYIDTSGDGVDAPVKAAFSVIGNATS